ncbi:MAG: hypothetical protein ACM3UY_06515 [Methanocella sp.]
MQFEKKLVLCSIFAIAIGAATIIPLEYLMTGEVGANARTVFNPWFDVTVPYAYVNLHDIGGNNTMTWDGAMIQATANFTLTPDAINLNNADAKIEFYQFRVYSDQGAIVNITYSVAVTREEIDVPGIPGGCYLAIESVGNNKFTFADGTIYDGNTVVGDSVCGGSQVLANMPGILPVQNSTIAVVSSYMANYNGDDSEQAVTLLRNAQKLYIDISRICSVAYQGNSSSTTATTTTMASNEVLQHIELTKIDNGFVWGTYKEGTVPFPIQTPQNPTGGMPLLNFTQMPSNTTLP